MHNVSMPPGTELPSSRALLRSTLIAAATAAVLLVTIVLPAEYGVDPTGIGRVVGLTQMGEIKMALAEEAEAAVAAEAQAEAALAAESDPVGEAAESFAAQDTVPNAGAPVLDSHEVTITLQPGEGKEIKLAMREGARVEYSWATQTGIVNYDTHGDPVDAPRDFYHGYGRGQGVPSDEGVLIAAFDGLHGWFWRNRTNAPVTLTLRTRGDYQELRELD